MARKTADRLVWAVDTLNIAPNEHILEVGCGQGAALTLVCDRLTTGKITALDRSEKMLRMAAARNSACLEAGKAHLLHTSLVDASLQPASFDKAFAVHVNVFWMRPERELAVIKAALKPDGKFFLFYQPLDASKTDELVGKLTTNLHIHGFKSVENLSSSLPSGLTICVTGSLS